MTQGHAVERGALTAHARGSQDQAGNFRELAEALEQARVSDDCFGPLGEVLAFKYFDALEECQGLASQAQRFLEVTADKVTDAAKTYGAMEEASASDFNRIDVGGGGRGGSGQSGKESDWSGLAQATGSPRVAIDKVNARADQLQLVTSPGQAFADNGLGWLIGIVITPLVEWVIEPAIGDPAQMRSTAAGWEQVAQWVEGAGSDEKQRADGTAEPWEGGAGVEFRKQMSEFSGGATALAEDIRGLTGILELAAELFDTFIEIVIDMLTELVIGLIITWLAALAASWITFGGSFAAASATTTAQTSTTGTRLSTEVLKVQKRLHELLTELEEWLKKLRNGKLKGLVDKLDDMRAGSWVQKKMAGAVDNLGGKVLSQGASRADVLESGTKIATGLATGHFGRTEVGSAAFTAARTNIQDEAIDQYEQQSENQAANPPTEEDRRAATDRGFRHEEYRFEEAD